MTAFATDYQLVRVEAADFDRDGDLDLIVSTNAINALSCPLRLYRNQRSEGNLLFDGDRYDCVSQEASTAMAVADLDNDDWPDLAFSPFASQSLHIITNTGGLEADTLLAEPTIFTDSRRVLVDAELYFLPYDFAWGDYDGDGYLDLAAAFPLQREARIYRNDAGKGLVRSHTLRTTRFRTPLAVDWGDFDGDGQLDLVVGDNPPKFYRVSDEAVTPIFSLDPTALSGQLWSLQAVDLDGDSDLDLALTKLDGPSALFTLFAPRLAARKEPISTEPASGVAWGDANGDGLLDLAIAAGPGALRSELFLNQHGHFEAEQRRDFDGFGPHTLAFGEMTGDGLQDLVVGIAYFPLKVYATSDPNLPAWQSVEAPDTRAVAWGDADDDRKLDLLVGGQGTPLALYLNQGDRLATTPTWSSTASQAVRSVAWGDYDGDYFLDFAVADGGEDDGADDDAIHLYRNNGNATFTLARTVALPNVSVVAWGEVTGDQRPDLAIGVNGGELLILPNTGDGLASEPVWRAPVSRYTTSLAWGDMDNDGDLDLAVGNDGEPDQLYLNSGLIGGEPQLQWLWSSQEAHATTGVAWGDQDGDGDLDLAVSSLNGTSGVYRNHYVTPSHLTTPFTPTLPLPNNRSYASVTRPGQSHGAEFYSSAEILSGVLRPTVTLQYRLFDADGTRQGGEANTPGDPLTALQVEYSLDGGVQWRTATRASTTPPPSLVPYRLGTLPTGQPFTFVWDAQADQAISDNARVRVRLLPTTTSGGMQHGSTVATSLPFRVRGLTCVWPRVPTIRYTITDWAQGKVRFVGVVEEGSGSLTFAWNFGDGTPTVFGQVINHTFNNPERHQVTLTVTGLPCPQTRAVSVSHDLLPHRLFVPLIIMPPWPHRLYAPLVLGPVGSETPRPPSEAELPNPTLWPVPTLSGASEPTYGTLLTWSDPPPTQLPEAYHLYRAPLGGTAFERIARVPASLTRYTDSATCGYVYYLTAITGGEESGASSSSFASLPCE